MLAGLWGSRGRRFESGRPDHFYAFFRFALSGIRRLSTECREDGAVSLGPPALGRLAAPGTTQSKLANGRKGRGTGGT
jgi:hypothetical protein